MNGRRDGSRNLDQYLRTVGDEEHKIVVLLGEPLPALLLLLLHTAGWPTMEVASQQGLAPLPAAGGPWRRGALEGSGHVGSRLVIGGAEDEGAGPCAAEERLGGGGVLAVAVVAQHVHGVLLVPGCQRLVLHRRLVRIGGGAEEVIDGGLRRDCRRGVEGVEQVEAELRCDGRNAGGGGEVRLAGVQVPGLVRHQELALRVIHPCLICALLKHTVCGSAFHQKKIWISTSTKRAWAIGHESWMQMKKVKLSMLAAACILDFFNKK